MADLSSTGAVLVTLLDVQAADVEADQLLHRKESLIERAAQAEQSQALGAIELECNVVKERSAELLQTQQVQEDEIGLLSAKIIELDRTLNSGSVSASRDLQAMQAEIESMQKRRGVLEDHVLELMEEAESLNATLAELQRRGLAHQGEIDRLGTVIRQSESELDEALAEVMNRRAGLAREVPSDLLTIYERLRVRLGGVAIARLDSRRCLGCHLELPSVELDAIRHAPPDATLFHEECGRILVR